MAKIKIKDNTDNAVVSPTQSQMDEWVAQELAEADETQMLVDETPQTLFDNESID